MKRAFILFVAIFTCFSIYKVAKAQDTLPPLGLPTIDESPTPTSTVTSTSTPVQVTTLTTVTPTTQEYVDDAETGSEFIWLTVISLLGGTGIFFIKKHFDIRKYSL